MLHLESLYEFKGRFKVFENHPEFSEFLFVHLDLSVVHMNVPRDHIDLRKHVLSNQSQLPMPLLSFALRRDQVEILIMLTLVKIFAFTFFIDVI